MSSEHGATLRAAMFFCLTVAVSALVACGGERKESVVELDLGGTIRDLGSDDLEVSSRAQSRLAAVGTPALPALGAALRQGPEPVRLGAVEVLAGMEGDEASRILIGALADPGAQVRADAAFALRTRRGAEVDRALTQALDDPAAPVRQRAAVACGAACRSGDAVRALVARALDDPEMSVAWAASASIARLRAADPELARPADAAVLAAAPARLAGSDVGRRAPAAILLAEVGDVRAAPILEVLVNEGSDTRLRLKVVYALGQVGGPSAIPPLQGLLGDPGMAGYAYDAIRRAAARGVAGAEAALAGYDGPRPLAPLPPPYW